MNFIFGKDNMTYHFKKFFSTNRDFLSTKIALSALLSHFPAV